MSAPKLVVEESRKIREEMGRVNPGSARWKELQQQLEDLYKKKAGS